MTGIPADVQMAACQGGRRVNRAELAGEGAAQVMELSDCLCLGNELTVAQETGLRGLLSTDPDSTVMELAQAAVGGDTTRRWLFHAATQQDRLSARLEAAEEEGVQRLHGLLEATYLAALSRVGRKAADLVKKGGARGHDPVTWLDQQPVGVVRAALTELDEAKTQAAFEDLDGLAATAYTETATDIARVLNDELEPPEDEQYAATDIMEDVDRDEAVRLVKVSLMAWTLGRLARSADNETLKAAIPANIARDGMHAAGGADTTPAGGVPKSETGRVFVGGIESRGDGLATSQTVLDQVAPGAVTELVWDHRNAGDNVNKIHQSNDGLPLNSCDFRAGSPGGPRGCNCKWKKRIITP